jgi:DNA repair exonuclease SbcCD ATPase subunit
MRIKKLEWRNFSSYGNKNQVLEMQESSLYQIVGENGAGKTSISQAISFVLYGKVEGKKLGDIPNRINGNTWVKIELECDGNDIVVERGLDPNIFRLFVNGKEYDKANNRSVQEYLTDDILGIPHYVFSNTISLSINDFKSFIKMSPNDKRAIIDKIFGFHILNQMRDVLKEESRKIKTIIDTTTGKMSAISMSIEKSTSEMEDLISRMEVESKDKLDSLNESLSTFTDLNNIHSARISEFKEEERKFQEGFRSCSAILSKSKSNLSSIEKRINLYELEKCPTCYTKLDSEFHEDIKKSLVNEKFEAEKETDRLLLEYKSLEETEKDIRNIRSEITEKGSKIEAKIYSIQTEIRKMGSESRDSQLKSLENIIKNLSDDNDIASSDKFKAEEKINWVKTLDDILGERGVKQMAIRTILPSLNSEISDLLAEMHLQYQVVFDEEFNSKIYHMGIEIPTQTLSTGEMKKVDFIVLIAMLKLMKMKFSSINMLFLDELFSSVDPDGVHSILNILSKISKDLGLNVFVINHAPMHHEIFDWKLEVTKLNNFSSISIDRF